MVTDNSMRILTGRDEVWSLSARENLSPFLSPSRSFTLHQLVSRAGRLVILYCVLRGPVHRHRPKQTAAPQVKEIDEVPHTAVTARRERTRATLGWKPKNNISFERLDDSLEWALDGRGCNFKVLVSPGVHSLICSDAQNSNL